MFKAVVFNRSRAEHSLDDDKFILLHSVSSMLYEARGRKWIMFKKLSIGYFQVNYIF